MASTNLEKGDQEPVEGQAAVEVRGTSDASTLVAPNDAKLDTN